jgi:hypothetical protein
MTAKMSVSGGNQKLHRKIEIPADPKKECEIWHTIGAYLIAGSAPLEAE